MDQFFQNGLYIFMSSTFECIKISYALTDNWNNMNK